MWMPSRSPLPQFGENLLNNILRFVPYPEHRVSELQQANVMLDIYGLERCPIAGPDLLDECPLARVICVILNTRLGFTPSAARQCANSIR